MNDPKIARQEAIAWAKDLMQRTDFCVIDVETTGIEDPRPVQIAILSHSGEVLLDTLVNPGIPIPARATEIHGITDEMVKDAPGIVGCWMRGMADYIDDMLVISYNAAFDARAIYGTSRGLNVDIPSNWSCAMEAYAKFCGVWAPLKGSWKYQKLPGAQHGAVADCRAVLSLIRLMAESE